MYRGPVLFLCEHCGQKFVGPDCELAATCLTAPVKCPYCGEETNHRASEPLWLWRLRNK